MTVFESVNSSIEAICGEILRDLEQLYRDYRSARLVVRKGLESIFAKWMRLGGDQIAPVDQAFLQGVSQTVVALAENLRELSAVDRITGEKIAGRGLEILFAPKSRHPVTDVERYLAIAEYSAAPLFPYASLQHLHGVRENLVRRVPKRMMLPKELELLTFLEERL